MLSKFPMSAQQKRQKAKVVEEPVEVLEHGESAAMSSVLDDCVLACVFSKLSTWSLLGSCSFVCRRWHRVAKTAVSGIACPPWAARDYEYKHGAAPAVILDAANCYRSSLETLDLLGLDLYAPPEGPSDGLLPWDKLCAFLDTSPPKLRALLLSPAILKRPIGQALPRLPDTLEVLHVENLEVINARTCRADNVTSSYGDWLQLLASCPLRLRELHIGSLDDFGCKQDRITLLGHLPTAAFSHSLRRLHLSHSGLTWADVRTILESFPCLSSLSVISKQLSTVSEQGDSQASKSDRRNRQKARPTTGRLPPYKVPANLTSLRLYTQQHKSVQWDSGEALTLLRSTGMQLRCMHAQGSFKSTWQNLTTWAPRISILDLSTYNDLSPFDAPELTKLDEVVLCGAFKVLTSLKRLALPRATDKLFTALGRRCHLLEELRTQPLYTDGCDNLHDVTNLGVAALAEGCPELKVLELSNMAKITDAAIRSLASSCHKLAVLLLDSCKRLSADCIKLLLPRLGSTLQVLDLGGGTPTNIETLKALCTYAERNPMLLRVVVLNDQHLKEKPAKEELCKLKFLLPYLHVRNWYSGIGWYGLYSARNLVH